MQAIELRDILFFCLSWGSAAFRFDPLFTAKIWGLRVWQPVLLVSEHLFNLRFIQILLVIISPTKPVLEKNLNSSSPFGQVTLKFCLPGTLPHSPRSSNSLFIICEPKNLNNSLACLNAINPSWVLSFVHFHVCVLVCYFLNYALGIFKKPWINVFSLSKVLFNSSDVIETESFTTPKMIIFECVILKTSRIKNNLVSPLHFWNSGPESNL